MALPTADVVPKSKYDLAVAEREANVKGFTEELAKAKTEVEFLRKTIAENAQRGLQVTLEEIEKAKTEVVDEFVERLKEQPIKCGLPLFGLSTKEEIEEYFNGIMLQVRDAIDSIAEEMKGGAE
jgi:hypothetical protein